MWFGKDIFGECDRVPGLLSVGTLFHHMCFFPLIPVHSMIIFAGTEQVLSDRLSEFSYSFGWRQIPLNRKSVCLGYIRAVAWMAVIVGGILGAFMALVALSAGNGWEGVLPWSGALVAGGAVVWVTHRWFRDASRQRAIELAGLAQMPEDVIQAIREGHAIKQEIHVESE